MSIDKADLLDQLRKRGYTATGRSLASASELNKGNWSANESHLFGTAVHSTVEKYMTTKIERVERIQATPVAYLSGCLTLGGNKTEFITKLPADKALETALVEIDKNWSEVGDKYYAYKVFWQHLYTGGSWTYIHDPIRYDAHRLLRIPDINEHFLWVYGKDFQSFNFNYLGPIPRKP